VTDGGDGPPPPEASVSRLRELGKVSYWQRRQRQDRRSLRRSLRTQRLRSGLDSRRQDSRVVADLSRKAVFPVVTALLLVVVSELVGWAINRAGWTVLDHVDHRLDPGSYETLAAAAVTAEAAFLALFYTTVGVVASTAYQTVPGERFVSSSSRSAAAQSTFAAWCELSSSA
jgi:hypothetical protein